jgi:hypothetical protein
MTQQGMRVAILMVAVCFTLACEGKGGDNTAPSTTYVLSFTPDTTNAPPPGSFYIDQAPNTSGTDEIFIRFNANFTQPFWKVRADILFTASVLEFQDYTDGTYMQQGGVTPDRLVTTTTGRITIQIDRPNSSTGVTGSGTILTLHFTPRDGTDGQSSPIRFNGAHAYTDSFQERLLSTIGGTIAVESFK